MAVSKGLQQLGTYVAESAGDEKVFALCVFMDMAQHEGSEDAERFCAKVLAKQVAVGSSTDSEADELALPAEERQAAHRLTVESLLETAALLDRSRDRELVAYVAKQIAGLLRTESDVGLRAKCKALLSAWGISLKRLPPASLAFIAAATLSGPVSLAA